MPRNEHVPKFHSILAFVSHRKFAVLLAVMLLLNLTRMVTVDDFNDQFILDVLGAVLLFAATLSLCVEKRSRAIALVLGIPAILLSLSRSLFSEQFEYYVQVADRLSSLFFLAFAIIIILQTLLTKPIVSQDSIAGAFCGYILIGVMFAEAFCLLESISPNSYRVSDAAMESSRDPFQRWIMLEYFSFTTLTTLGFGDVVPVSTIARSLAIWEAICGQFYLAVLVAGLVNLSAARAPEPVDF